MQSAQLDEVNAAMVRDKLHMIQTVQTVQYIGIALASLVLAIVSLTSLCLCRAAQKVP